MTITAAAVLLAARDQHPAFTPQRCPDAMLWRVLSQYHQRLVGRVAAFRAQVLAPTRQTITLPLADFDAGGTLAASPLRVLDADAALTGAETATPVEIVPYGARLHPHHFPAIAIEDTTVTLLDTADRWQPYASVSVRYVGVPAALTSGAATLILPDDAIGTCAAHLAAFMATRLAADGQPLTRGVVGILRDDAASSEADWLGRLGTMRTSEVSRIREVY